MSGIKEKIYYWDSCVYLAWLKGEESHGKQYLEALRQIAHDNCKGKNVIITSTMTQIEVLDSKLTEEQKESNRIKSKTRARVEHIFGSQAQMGGHIVHTIGKLRAAVKIGMMNLVYNMRRLGQLIKRDVLVVRRLNQVDREVASAM